MVAFTGSSLGYAGSITETSGKDFFNYTGAGKYGVAGFGDARVEVTTGDRMLLVNPGTVWGHNIVDTISSGVTVQLDAVSSGSRWDMVVVRRDASLGSTIEVVKGTSSKALPSLTSSTATHPDQPLALCRVTAGQTTVQEIEDLRVWPGSGGLYAVSSMVRSYLDQPGSDLLLADGSRSYLNAGKTWVPIPGRPSILEPGTRTGWDISGRIVVDPISWPEKAVTLNLNIVRMNTNTYPTDGTWSDPMALIPSPATGSSQAGIYIYAETCIVRGNDGVTDVQVRISPRNGTIEFRKTGTSSSWTWSAGGVMSINLPYFIV